MLLIFKEKKHLYLNSHPQLLPLKSMTSREIISTSYGTNSALSNQLYYYYYRRSDALVHSECVFFSFFFSYVLYKSDKHHAGTQSSYIRVH